MVVGALCVYWPDGHCARCVEHSRFDVAVGFVDSHSLAVHVVAAAHGSPSFAPDQLVPTTHAEHTRSVVGVPADVWPWPAGHVRHATHDCADVAPAAENVPDAHGLHDALTAVA